MCVRRTTGRASARGRFGFSRLCVAAFALLSAPLLASVARAQGQPDIAWQGAHSSYVRYTVFSPDGRLLASGGDDRTNKLWQATTGAPVLSWQQCGGLRCGGSTFGYFSPDSQTLATTGVKFWNTSNGALLRTVSAGGEIGLSPDWQYLASSVTVSTYPSTTRSFTLLRAADGATAWTKSGMGGGQVAFSRDGQLVAAVGFAGVDIWRVSDGSFVRTVVGPRKFYGFTPDGQYLVTAGGGGGAFRYDDTVKLYRVADGALVRTHSGTGVVTSVAFTPDGRLMLVGSWDTNPDPVNGYMSQIGSVRVYRLSDGALLKTYDQQTGTSANAVSVSPDGTFFAYSHESTVVAAHVPTSECTYTISPARIDLPSSGGSGDVHVSAPAGCAWRAVSRSSWLRIDSGAQGSGDGTVKFSTTSSGNLITGMIVIAEQSFPVLLGTDPCTYNYNNTALDFPIEGGSGALGVQTDGGCGWTASASSADWLTITAVTSDSGGGSVKFTVAPNTGPPRSTTLTTGGRSYQITQAGQQPSFRATGRVTDAQGNPLSGATVSLTGAQSATATTDDAGNYSFSNLQPGASYALSPSFDGFAFSPQSASLSNVSGDASADFTAARGAPPPLLISEFRLGGYAGTKDEYVELYNNTDQPLTVSTTDGSQGWALAAPDSAGASVLCVIPNGTTIPPRGHYLVANTSADGGYSLPVAPDETYSTDVGDSAGVGLFSTAAPAHMTLAYRLDAAGYAGAGAPQGALYREGAGLSYLPSAGAQYAYVRRMTAGAPQYTGDNAADFVLVSTDPSSVVGSALGAPGPENSASPVNRTAQIKPSLFAPCLDSSSAPNRERASVAYEDTLTPTTTYANGTLRIRRRFTNRTGEPVTALRFRIVDVTAGTSEAGWADLRALSSGNETGIANPCGAASTRALALELSASQQAGGGLNSTLAQGTISNATPLAPGASVDLNFLLGVQQTGNFRFFVIVEALPSAQGATSAPAAPSAANLNGGKSAAPRAKSLGAGGGGKIRQ